MICAAHRADGSPCRAPAIADSGICMWHDERFKETRLAASARGGRKPHVELPQAEALTPERARQFIASLCAGVVGGSVDPNTARSLTYMIQVNRQLQDSEAVERRLDELERQIASGRPPRSDDGASPRHESLKAKRDRILGR